VKKTLLDFSASISDIKQVNPLFSTCKVTVMYTGENRNKSTITKQSVEKALPTLANIPIVGEFSVESQDFKGHGGAIDLTDYKFIHTTKPYGVVPESATYEWVNAKDPYGNPHEYLVINGCYLWTGRYEEAESIIQNGKGQSMEIEVVDGEFDKLQDSYIIKDFIFSALCILGDDVEPAFEGANITAYSLDKDSFKREFSLMLKELKSIKNKEGYSMEKLKQLLKQYSVSMEEVTASGIVLEGLSEEQMEFKFSETFGNKGAMNKNQHQITKDPNSDNSENAPEGTISNGSQSQWNQMMGTEGENYASKKQPENAPNNGDEPDGDEDGKDTDNDGDGADEQNKKPAKKQNHSAVGNPDELELEPVIQDKNNDDPSSLKGKVIVEDQGDKSFEENEEEDFSNQDPTQVEPVKPVQKNKDNKDSQKVKVQEIEKDAKFQALLAEVEALKSENAELKDFKLQVETAEKQAKADKLFKDFQLTEEDIKDISISNFSLEEIEEKCYAILGRKIVSKKNFSKEDSKGIHLPINNIGSENNNEHSRYGNLFNK